METESSFEQLDKNTGSKPYNIEGRPVTLRWKEFKPKEPKIDLPGQESGIVFMPGWAIPTGGTAVEPLCEQFAEVSGEKVYTVEALGDPRKIKQLDAAEATRQYIIEKKLKNVTIVGNSQAGVRAIDLVSLLRKNNPEIQVNGLILPSSMGLYDQSVLGILMRLATDAIKTNKILGQPENEEIKELNDKAMKENFHEFVEQVKAAKGNIPHGVYNLGKDMGSLNPRLKDVDVPVVLLQGAEDVLSNPHKIVPPELGLGGAKEHAQKLKEYKQDPANKEEPESVVAQRAEYLLNELFPNSKGVKMIIAEKLSVHGLPYLRYRQAALGSLIALERLNGIHGNKTKLNTNA